MFFQKEINFTSMSSLGIHYVGAPLVLVLHSDNSHFHVGCQLALIHTLLLETRIVCFSLQPCLSACSLPPSAAWIVFNLLLPPPNNIQ